MIRAKGVREPDHDGADQRADGVPRSLIGFGEYARTRALTDHRDLDVWKVSIGLAREIYRLTAAYPAGESNGQMSQMRSAAVCMPSDISEDYCRESGGSCQRSLRIAQGSAMELQTPIGISSPLGHVKAPDRTLIEETIARVTTMLLRLIRGIERNNRK